MVRPNFKPDMTRIYALPAENNVADMANSKYKYKRYFCLLSSSHHFSTWIFDRTDKTVHALIQKITPRIKIGPPFNLIYYKYTSNGTYPLL